MAMQELVYLWWVHTTTRSIASVTNGTKKWVVNGIDLTAEYPAGALFYADDDAGANEGTWTVASSTYTGGNTEIVSVEAPNTAGAGGTIAPWRKIAFSLARLKPMLPTQKGVRLRGRSGVEKQLISPDSTLKQVFSSDIAVMVLDTERQNSTNDGIADYTLADVHRELCMLRHHSIRVMHQQDYYDAANNAKQHKRVYDCHLEPNGDLEGSQFTTQEGGEDVELRFFCERDGSFTGAITTPTTDNIAWRTRP